MHFILNIVRSCLIIKKIILKEKCIIFQESRVLFS